MALNKKEPSKHLKLNLSKYLSKVIYQYSSLVSKFDLKEQQYIYIYIMQYTPTTKNLFYYDF